MSAEKTSPRRILLLTAATTLVAAVVAAVLIFLLPSFGNGGARGAAAAPGPAVIPAVAPADADTFVMAPYSEAWWAKISAMAAPETRLADADPVPAGHHLDRIGYSRSPDSTKRGVPMTGPLRLFYLEAPSEEEAGKVAEWMRSAPGFEGRRVHVSGRVVILSASWVTSFKPPTKTMSTVAGYRTDETPGKGTYWMNVDQQTESLTGAAGKGQKEASVALVRNGMGFAEGTTWLGTSDAGNSWAGRFAAGGVKRELINFDKTLEAVAATDQVLASSKVGNVSYRALATSASSALSVTRITVEGQQEALGTGAEQDFPKVASPVMSASTEVTDWDAALSGIYGAEENVSSRHISANESEMIVSFGYAGQ